MHSCQLCRHIAVRGIAKWLTVLLITIGSASTSAIADSLPGAAEITRADAPVHGRPEEKMAFFAPARPSIPALMSSEPFGLDTVTVVSGDLLTRWRSVEIGLNAESETLARCRADVELCTPASERFLAIIAEGRARQGRARIGVINRAINMTIRPMSDLAQWGVPDLWSTPLSTLSTGRGDCEDYAIAKYAALIETGIAEEDVRLVVVHDLATDQDHAIVAARLNGDWIVLDNRWLALARDFEMRGVVPLFVLDQNGVRRFVPRAKEFYTLTAEQFQHRNRHGHI